MIGECKDRGYSPSHGSDGGTINANDIDNLRYVAVAFPRSRFQVFILLAKLCLFTASEVELARSLNSDYQERVIMLTDRELDPNFVFERTSKTFDIPEHAVAAEDLARATVSIYFEPRLKDSAHDSAAGKTFRSHPQTRVTVDPKLGRTRKGHTPSNCETNACCPAYASPAPRSCSVLSSGVQACYRGSSSSYQSYLLADRSLGRFRHCYLNFVLV